MKPRPRNDARSDREQLRFVGDWPGHDRRYGIDATKRAGTTGWQLVESFDTGLRKTVRWYLDNHAWVDRVIAGSDRQPNT